MNELEVRGLEIDEDSYKTNEKLTEQVLTLPRQFRPIDLKNNRILQTNGDATILVLVGIVMEMLA